MNGKITDIGWYKPMDTATARRGIDRNTLAPISYEGKSDRFNRNHTVPKHYLEQRSDAMTTLNYLLQAYSLKGFEFGNWTTQSERNGFANDIATTLMEMSKWMGTWNIGFDHNIGIAFGARGSRGAAAHYEPGLNMINLTRRMGIGSLAHEYGHALDYCFGAFVDQNPLYTALSGGDSIWTSLSPTVAEYKANNGGQLRALTNCIVDSIKNSDSFAILRMSKTKPYWRRRTEVFARFFEQYVCYIYKQKGQTNKILTKSWEHYILFAKKFGIYLSERDFLRIKPVADQLLKEMAAFMNDRKSAVRATAYPAPVILPAPEPKPQTGATSTAAGRRVAADKKSRTAKPAESKPSASASSRPLRTFTPEDTKPPVIRGVELVSARDLCADTGIPAKAWRDLFHFTATTEKDKPTYSVMTGIYIDPAGYAVATDARILAFVPCKKSKYAGKLVYPNGVLKTCKIAGKEVQCINNHDRVLPTKPYFPYVKWQHTLDSKFIARNDYHLAGTFDIAALIRKIETAPAVGKEELKIRAVRILDEKKADIYNAERAVTLLRFLANFDDKVALYAVKSSYDSGSGRALICSTKTAQALLMPMVLPK